MHFAFTLASILLLSLSLNAQCPDLQLADLQNIQRASGSDRDAAITDIGFDLISETPNTRRFNRCWRSTDPGGKTLYDQAILCNKQNGHTTFMCSNKKAFLRLRQEIEDRKGGSTMTVDQSDVYIGHQFRYEFSIQNMDGLEYYVVKISAK